MSIGDVIRDPANEVVASQTVEWTHIIIHNTGAWEKNPRQVKDYHLSLGWRDVGYNYLIDYAGAVHIGRPLDIPGAHCTAYDMNRRGIGVALLGDFNEKKPTANQINSLYALCTKLCAVKHIQPECILAHGEVPGAATACPGKHLDISAVRRVVKRVVIKTPV